jgi:hypothetical protein
MEPEGSVPCSQDPATGPYPEPDESGPHHDIVSTLILLFHPRLGLPRDIFPIFFVQAFCNFSDMPNYCLQSRDLIGLVLF